VYALSVGDIANERVGVDIHDLHVGSVRNVEATSRAIYGEIIPETLATHGNSLNDVITGSAR
jgi:hypothetical protein